MTYNLKMPTLRKYRLITILVIAFTTVAVVTLLYYWDRKPAPADLTIRTSYSGRYQYINDNQNTTTGFRDRTDNTHVYSYQDKPTNTSLSFHLPETKNEPKSSTKDNRVILQDVYPHTDLSYQITDHGVKEDIILKTSDALVTTSYLFILKTQGLKPQQDAAGNILLTFTSHDDQKTVFQLLAPFMIDAGGNRSETVSLTIQSSPADLNISSDSTFSTYYVLITPDPNWLTDPERQFPVAIDPTVVKGNAPITDLHIDEGYGTTAYDASGNENDFTISGATWEKNSASSEAGNINLRFDGSNDYLLRSSDASFNFGTGSFTLSGWFRHSATAPASGTDMLIARHVNAGWKIYMNTSGYVCFGVDDDSSWGPDASICTSAALGSLADSRWHHVSAVKTSTTSIAIYIDGTLINETSTGIPSGSLD